MFVLFIYFYHYYSKPFDVFAINSHWWGTSRVMVNKTIIDEFDSYWVPHISGLIPQLS